MVQIQLCARSYTPYEMPDAVAKGMQAALKLALDHKLTPKEFVFNEQATLTDPHGEFLKIGVVGESE